MSSRSATGNTGDSRGRIRPLTIAIVIVCALLIVAALSAWRGSADQYGRIPEVRFATSTWSEHAEPYQYATLEDSGGDEEQLSREISEEQTLTIGLPVELIRTDFSILLVRTAPDGTTTETVEDIAAHSDKTITVPAETEEGLLSGVVLTTTLPMPVYDDAGEESILAGEWSLKLSPAN